MWTNKSGAVGVQIFIIAATKLKILGTPRDGPLSEDPLPRNELDGKIIQQEKQTLRSVIIEPSDRVDDESSLLERSSLLRRMY